MKTKTMTAETKRPDGAVCDALFADILGEIKTHRGYMVDIPQLKNAYQAEKAHTEACAGGWEELHTSLMVVRELVHIMCPTAALIAALPRSGQPQAAEAAGIAEALSRIRESTDFSTLLSDETDRGASPAVLCKAFQIRFTESLCQMNGTDSGAPERQCLMARIRTVLIPAAVHFGMRYFELILRNECYRLENEARSHSEYADITAQTRSLTEVSTAAYARFDALMNRAVSENQTFSFAGFNPFTRLQEGEHPTAVRRALLPWEIRNQLDARSGFERSRLDLWEVLLVCKADSEDRMLEQFIAFHRIHLKDHLTVEYVKKDRNHMVFRLTDSYENNYRVILIPESRLPHYFFGDFAQCCGAANDLADARSPKITVYTYSEQTGYQKHENLLPANSTVLDLAFYLDPSAALYMNGASIHPWNQDVPPQFSDRDYRFPLRTRLNHGDTVCFVPGQETGGICAGFDWFSAVNTDYARKCLIRFFKERFPT